MSLFDLQLELEKRHRYYRAVGVDETISPTDDMYDPARAAHYLQCGRDAVRLIALGMSATGLGQPRRILDMPSGSGRVTRHLVRFFPEATVTACDLYQHHVDFCARQFSAKPFMSKDDLATLELPERFDLIWCGSLLTHLPASGFASALQLFARSLADGGIALITTHGRWAVFRQRYTDFKYATPDAFVQAEETLDRGFGYVDYSSKKQCSENAAYGTSWSMPSYVLRLIEPMEDIRVVGFVERGWDNHQDVLILQKKPIHGRPWIFEEGAGAHDAGDAKPLFDAVKAKIGRKVLGNRRG